MNKCKECGRILIEGEDELCLACQSAKSHKKKRLVEYIVAGGLVISGIAVTAVKFFIGKGGDDA